MDARKAYRKHGTGHLTSEGYLSVKKDGKYKFEHVLVAEKAIGKTLPNGAAVHHIDGNRLNNSNNNLVICPSNSYHILLHTRQSALKDSGNAEHRKCGVCGNYDSKENMSSWSKGDRNMFWHKECKRIYDKERNLLIRGTK